MESTHQNPHRLESLGRQGPNVLDRDHAPAPGLSSRCQRGCLLLQLRTTSRTGIESARSEWPPVSLSSVQKKRFWPLAHSVSDAIATPSLLRLGIVHDALLERQRLLRDSPGSPLLGDRFSVAAGFEAASQNRTQSCDRSPTPNARALY